MSCYIDTELSAYLGRVWELTKDQFTRMTGIEVANILHKENVRSFNYRHESDEPSESIDRLPSYSDYSLLQISKSISCLRYQSCEHPEWGKSQAASILEELLDRAIRHEKIEEWEDKEWGAPKRA